ncbi:MAG: hypothetical protein RR595_06415 [Lysinibacillus sp.]
MNKKNRTPVIFVILTNAFFICIAQVLFALVLIDKTEMTTLLLIFLPLVIISINIIIWLSKFRIEFYQHWLIAYIVFFCSIIIFYFIQAIHIDLSEWKDSPLGEAYFDLFLFVFITSACQLIILFSLNIITYLFYRGAYYLTKRI